MDSALSCLPADDDLCCVQIDKTKWTYIMINNYNKSYRDLSHNITFRPQQSCNNNKLYQFQKWGGGGGIKKED